MYHFLQLVIVQPIFNVLVLIDAIIPGHNFGLAIILFTILVRIVLYPLLRKQLYHAKAMRELAPELKKIKASTKGDRQKESMLTMELYKERQINPFASLGVVLLQVPILIGLYAGLRKIILDPNQIVNFSYPILHNHLSWFKDLKSNINDFDNTLFGVVNLSRTATGVHGFYLPALILGAGSAVMQYFQSKMLMPQAKDSRRLRDILSEAGQGKSADQSEVSAAVGRGTLFFIPAVVFLISLSLAAALPLYWFVSSLVAYIQQRRILGDDVKDAGATVKVSTRVETEDDESNKPKPKKHHRKSSKKRKRR